jgi:hypothetical protein
MTANLISSLRSSEAFCLRKQARHLIRVSLFVQDRSETEQRSEIVGTQF